MKVIAFNFRLNQIYLKRISRQLFIDDIKSRYNSLRIESILLLTINGSHVKRSGFKHFFESGIPLEIGCLNIKISYIPYRISYNRLVF